MKPKKPQAIDVIILGAGAAGLAAGQILASSGLKICILEARKRLGGRLHTRHDSNTHCVFELGAEFIHGTQNVIWDLVRAEQLSTHPVEDQHLYRNLSDRLSNPSELNAVFEDLIRQGYQKTTLEDLPFSQFLETWETSTDSKILMKGYVEGFYAAHLDQISTQMVVNAERIVAEKQGHQSYVISQGYQQILKPLTHSIQSHSGEIKLDTQAYEVQWKPNEVTVLSHDSNQEHLAPVIAKKVLLTLPISILKLKHSHPHSIRFFPTLEDKHEILNLFEMGQAIKVICRFQNGKLPPSILQWNGFIHDFSMSFPTWWKRNHAQVTDLIGWAGGPQAEALSGLQREEVIEKALSSLAKWSQLSKTELQSHLLSWHFHSWDTDPFSQGAYSYVKTGGIQAPQVLARPIENTLFFAGEATDTEGLGGTIDSAILSGRRAAREILKSI